MKPFRHYLRVRYGECDAQKVVYNSRYGDYVDIATGEFFRAIGFGDAIINGHMDYQLVRQTVEWKAPARYDQILEISVATKRTGNTSLTISTDFRVAGEERVIVTAETVYVLLNADTMEKMTIPEGLRVALEKPAADAVTDHAGYFAIAQT